MTRLGSIRSFVGYFLQLRGVLESAPSATGMQLEILANSEGCKFVRRDDGDALRSLVAKYDRLELYAQLTRVWSSLTTEEQRVIELKNSTKIDEHGSADSFTIIREVRHASIQEGDGVTVIELCRDEDGALTGWVKIEDTCVRQWSTEDIARQLGLTERQVITRITDGYGKIEDHPIYRQLRE